MGILHTLLLWQQLFFNSYSTTQLPSSIQAQMNLRIQQGVCQKQWVEDLNFVQVFSTHSARQKIYAAPCSFWAHNQAWSLFLVMDQNKEQELIKPLFFIRHSSYKGLYADSVVENISWDSEKKILTSKKYLNGRTHCGEIAGYEWNENNQDFKVVSIYKNDNCNISHQPWEKVL